MSLILNLETSTNNCSISIANKGKCLIMIEEYLDPPIHSDKLHLFIQYAIDISKICIHQLKSICISTGPGLYTSLRIGMSAAKGLCNSLDIPLLSLDSLTIMCHKINNIKSEFLIPIICQKSNYCYTSIFNKLKKRITPIYKNKNDCMINFFKNFMKKKNKAYYFGYNINCIINSLHYMPYIPYMIYPSSMEMSNLSYIQFCNKKFENITKLIPFY
ncbi:tRNA (adenosine(37)-N6)-threonylcarbamoyltransferase complex dimerization subunit type 1 TsaB [Blattabacterium cuenoti]|uniref:tRNA (adenosine(37)-N6)-threonylcarbamoyltransferase complex dimerization subunit type 1 TsaB n=1 Tax=Blattabacterium cuenoti TaxID=1653831 RepID=UPI00163C08BC|nr:tRNA (adenosine(37)-N6)-threonylcarbamoyltransferase complex dimerization subunit type 1 TsaB [Blattabacterium cuenoti]